MNDLTKMEILGQSAQYDICASDACLAGKGKGSAGRRAGPFGRWIYPAIMPNGKTVRILKVLMSNECRNNCSYCINRCSSNHPRASFKPDELARLFASLHEAKLVQGLFLSSAVQSNPDQTMEDMITTVEMVRMRYRFNGYVHLKVLPGASYDKIERMAELANRISINLESPNTERLKKLSSDKDFQNDLFLRMKWISNLIKQDRIKASGHTTQFVVGAADETDQEILQTTVNLYNTMRLERAYFSAFQPVNDGPLKDHGPTPLIREHRLYEADFLLRRYGFNLSDIILDKDGNLLLDKDPKKAWAEAHPEYFPIEINRAGRRDLMRVPGIGPTSATRIMQGRIRGDRCNSLEDLKALGAVTRWAAAYILINGKRPSVSSENIKPMPHKLPCSLSP